MFNMRALHNLLNVQVNNYKTKKSRVKRDASKISSIYSPTPKLASILKSSSSLNQQLLSYDIFIKKKLYGDCIFLVRRKKLERQKAREKDTKIRAKSRVAWDMCDVSRKIIYIYVLIGGCNLRNFTISYKYITNLSKKGKGGGSNMEYFPFHLTDLPLVQLKVCFPMSLGLFLTCLVLSPIGFLVLIGFNKILKPYRSLFLLNIINRKRKSSWLTSHNIPSTSGECTNKAPIKFQFPLESFYKKNIQLTTIFVHKKYLYFLNYIHFRLVRINLQF